MWSHMTAIDHNRGDTLHGLALTVLSVDGNSAKGPVFKQERVICILPKKKSTQVEVVGQVKAFGVHRDCS